MNNQIKGLLYFFSTNIRHSLFIFWSILFGILFVTLTISYLLKDGDGFMTMAFTAPLYVYFAVFGFIIVKSWIPFMVKIGATRKNITLSIGIFFTGLAIVFATVASLIQELITVFAETIDLGVFSFIHVAYFFTDTWYTRILMDFSICLFSFMLFFAIGLLFYKYGLAIGGTVLGSLFVIILLGLFQGWLSDFIINTFTDVNLVLFWQLMLVSFVIYGLSSLLMRNITIVKAR